MKTVLITGGASGLGYGIAMRCLKKGDRVIAIGSSAAQDNHFFQKAEQIGSEDRAFYIQADLSLIQENRRVIEEVRERFGALDAIIFCASKHSKSYVETQEGLELTFALDYLSRFILSYGFKDCLECTNNPAIINVCGSGMKGNVDWDDLQHKNRFDSQKVMMHGSRLNDLLGVGFVQNDSVRKIKYILYNPWAVQTPGMMNMFSSPLMRFVYRAIGKSVDEASIQIADLLDNLPSASLSAYREKKKLNLALPTYDMEKATKLHNVTTQLLMHI